MYKAHICTLYCIMKIMCAVLFNVILVACLSSISHGLVWGNQSADTKSFKSCSDLHDNFRSGVFASRKCNADEEWEDVDFTNCTMHLSSDPVVVTQATFTPANQSSIDIFTKLVSKLSCRCP